ncbi:MAG: phage tail protein, partial [Gammaproteobacteria bacterium]
MPPLVAGITVAAVAKFALTVAISLALSFIARLLTPKPKGAQDRGLPLTIRSSIAPRQYVYGTTVVGGVLVFATLSGSTNQYLHFVVALAGHEVAGIDSIFFDDVEIANGALNGSGLVTTGRFANKVRVKKHLGADDQTADSDLVSEVGVWTTTHRLRGIAYVYLRLEFDRDVFPAGIPEIRVGVRGRKLWDLRSDPSDSSIKAFTNNAALCQLDYAMSTDGFNLTADKIHLASWAAAANICDEPVELAATGSPPLTEARYTCDGAFHLGVRRLDIMRDLMNATLGAVVWQQGQLRGYAAAATAANPTALTVDDLRDGISVVTRPSRDQLFNRVRGTYIDAEHHYIPTSFAPVTNVAYLAEDNDDPIWQDMTLDFTTGHARAQRMA